MAPPPPAVSQQQHEQSSQQEEQAGVETVTMQGMHATVTAAPIPVHHSYIGAPPPAATPIDHQHAAMLMYQQQAQRIARQILNTPAAVSQQEEQAGVETVTMQGMHATVTAATPIDHQHAARQILNTPAVSQQHPVDAFLEAMVPRGSFMEFLSQVCNANRRTVTTDIDSTITYTLTVIHHADVLVLRCDVMRTATGIVACWRCNAGRYWTRTTTAAAASS